MKPALVVLAIAALFGAGPPRVGSAGVTVALPAGWHSLPQAILPGVKPATDPVTRVVVASAPINYGMKGCTQYAFSSKAVAVVVVEWVRPTPSARFAPRPRRFTRTTLPVRPPPAIECHDGPGGGTQFADHGRRFAVYVLLGRDAPARLGDRARAVLDTLRVRRKG